MRRYENAIITDFLKQQNWKCRAAIATLRNRMGDDWLDLFLYDCCTSSCDEDILPFLCSSFWASVDYSRQGDFSRKLRITLDNFKQTHSEEKYGWIDTMLMSIVLQVVLKYFLKWLLENYGKPWC